MNDPLKVEKLDHPDLVDGIVWSDCELEWIRAYGLRCYNYAAANTKPDESGMTPDEIDLIAHCVFRYVSGRMTTIVGDAVNFLISHWSEFPEHTQKRIKTELETEMRRDDEARAEGRPYRALGQDCDRRDWDRLLAHIEEKMK